MEYRTGCILYGAYRAAAAGIYNAHLLESIYKLVLYIWLESSLQIKQAGGMQRGMTLLHLLEAEIGKFNFPTKFDYEKTTGV